MYVGVRAGGGIGDEIEDPAGDPYELYRILFDITFFFFVIVILLAIIQGESSNKLTNSNLIQTVNWLFYQWDLILPVGNSPGFNRDPSLLSPAFQHGK